MQSTRPSPSSPPAGARFPDIVVGRTAATPRRSRAARWRAAVLVLVHVLIAGHIAHWWMAGTTLSPLEPSEAIAFSRGSVINAGFLFFAAMILTTMVFGRFACGWACHLIALQDLARAALIRAGIRPRPLRSRALLWVPTIAFLYMFVYPLAWRLWRDPGALATPPAFELFASDFWQTFPGVAVGIATLLVCGFLVVYALGAKGFCTYACPYGAAFGAADRIAPWRIRVTDACEGCGHCSRTCSSNVNVAKEVREWGMVVNPGCMKCLDCVSVCPTNALYYGFGRPRLFARPRAAQTTRPRALGYREEALAAALFLAGFLAFRGLYGVIPFLLALGIGALLAVIGLYTARLFTAGTVRLQNLALKTGGTLTRAGQAWLALAVLVAALWAHSGWIRYHAWRAETLHAALQPVYQGWFDPRPAASAPLALQRAVALEAHARRVARTGLAPTPDTQVWLAWARLLQGDEDGFLHRLTAALDAAPDSAPLWMLAGHFHLYRADYPAAAAACRRALALDAGLRTPYNRHATGLALDGRTAAAERLFREGLAVTPGDPELYFNYGVLLADTGRPAAGADMFRRALALDPAHAAARENLARVRPRAVLPQADR